MTTPEHRFNKGSAAGAAKVDVLIVGAGITGIYQLYSRPRGRLLGDAARGR